jgi:hypothetical protein
VFDENSPPFIKGVYEKDGSTEFALYFIPLN